MHFSHFYFLNIDLHTRVSIHTWSCEGGKKVLHVFLTIKTANPFLPVVDQDHTTSTKIRYISSMFCLELDSPCML